MEGAGAGAGAGTRAARPGTEPLLSDPRYIIVLSVVVLIFTLLFWWFFSRRRHVRDSVLLTGLTEAGKTLLFVKLIYSEYRETFTSMKENIDNYVTSNGSMRIVDVPGQERLRNKFFDEFKASAKAIVYVVDSVSIQKDIRDVAEFLYTILSDKVVQKNSTSVLVLCNKQDQPLAKGSQVIKTLLEKELNLVRITKSSQLQSVDPSQSNVVTYLGKQGKDFEFSQLSNKVDFAECSAMNDNDESPVDIAALESWIAKL